MMRRCLSCSDLEVHFSSLIAPPTSSASYLCKRIQSFENLLDDSIERSGDLRRQLCSHIEVSVLNSVDDEPARNLPLDPPQLDGFSDADDDCRVGGCARIERLSADEVNSHCIEQRFAVCCQ
jgi:hypothetical protein